MDSEKLIFLVTYGTVRKIDITSAPIYNCQQAIDHIKRISYATTLRYGEIGGYFKSAKTMTVDEFIDIFGSPKVNYYGLTDKIVKSKFNKVVYDHWKKYS